MSSAVPIACDEPDGDCRSGMSRQGPPSPSKGGSSPSSARGYGPQEYPLHDSSSSPRSQVGISPAVPRVEMTFCSPATAQRCESPPVAKHTDCCVKELAGSLSLVDLSCTGEGHAVVLFLSKYRDVSDGTALRPAHTPDPSLATNTAMQDTSLPYT